MLDVHALNEKIESVREFALHIFTITIGLLIALALEGIVEWHYHRELVAQARASLHAEIGSNAKILIQIQQEIDNAQKTLDTDMSALAALSASPQSHPSMSLEFHIEGFDSTAWRTAQTTGVFSFMPYDDVREFARIYDTQGEVYATQQRVIDDVLHAGALVVNEGNNWRPDTALVAQLSDRIGQIKMRLLYEKALVAALDANYKRYRGAHP